MTLEDRLSNHMNEQAERMSFTPRDLSDITDPPSRGRGQALATVAAALVFIAAGVGYFAFASQNEVTGVATDDGTTDDDGTNDDGAEDSTDDAAPPVEFDITDITDANSPGGGEVVLDDGVYYVLSTSPGRVDPVALSEADALELFSQDTFYTYDGDGWQANEVEDRFISDFQVDEGVLYVLSTGTKSGDETSAIGSSPDQGQTWEWQELDGLESVNNVAMLRDGDATVIVASRPGYPGFGEAQELAAEAGLDLSDGALVDHDHKGLTYLPLEPGNPCHMLAMETGLLYLIDSAWASEEQAEAEMASLLESVGPDLEAAGCSLDIESWAPPRITTSWSDLGVQTPDAWVPWAGVFRHEAGELSELPNPFVADARIAFLDRPDDGITAYNFDADGLDLYTVYRSGDGIEWTEETVPGDEAFGWGPFNSVTTAGNSTFRIFHNTPSDEEADALEGRLSNASEDEMLALQAEWEKLHFTTLERSIDGGPWETIDPAELMPGIDLGTRTIEQVIGTDDAAFLVYTGGGNSPLVVYSSNGVDWSSFEATADWLSVSPNDDSLVLFKSRSRNQDDGSSRTETDVLLVTPRG